MKNFIKWIIKIVPKNSRLWNFLKRFGILRRIKHSLDGKNSIKFIKYNDGTAFNVHTNGIVPGSYTVEEIIHHSKIRD